MENFTLEKLMMGAGDRMRVDLAERLVGHPGGLGAGREEILREFLRKYLPKRFEISTGFVFDCHGVVSLQLDIIIIDPAVCSRFETAGGIRYYPCESVLAVGQVKSKVTSQKELFATFDNLESAKRLDRSGGGRASCWRTGEALDNTVNHRHQIFTFLFVTGDCLAGGSVVEDFLDYVLRHPAHVWPNVILSLDKYLVTFHCDDGVCPNPMHARAIAIQNAKPDDDVLIRFYLLLGRALDATQTATLPYWEYLEKARTWSPLIHHSTMDDPPPYLSTVSIA